MSCLTLGEINAKRPVHRFIGPHQVIVDCQLPRLAAELLAEVVEVLEVFLAQPVWIDKQPMGLAFD